MALEVEGEIFAYIVATKPRFSFKHFAPYRYRVMQASRKSNSFLRKFCLESDGSRVTMVEISLETTETTLGVIRETSSGASPGKFS
jgi:hypothetical protein